MTRPLPAPTRGYIVAYGKGPYFWHETFTYRAKYTRQRMGEIMAGINTPRKGATWQEGWAYARARGYRVVKAEVRAL